MGFYVIYMDESTFILQHRYDDVKALALQGHRYPGIDMPFVLDQISGWQIALNKLPAWAKVEGLVYPHHLSLEQCSSEKTALYKSSLIKGESLVDLTGGFGVDCYFLSQNFKHSTYVERQACLCEIAKENYSRLGSNINVVNADFDEFISTMKHVDWIFMDPARRDSNGGKVVAIADCEPDVISNLPVLFDKTDHILLKLSPMLDLKRAITDLNDCVEQAHIVSVDNECKELLLVVGRNKVDNVSISCVNIRKGMTQTFHFTFQEEVSAKSIYTDKVETYLYEPNVSLLKAGCFRILGQQFGLKKLHPNSHLYTSDLYIENFPGRIFEVQKCIGFSKKELKEGLKGIEKANLTIRNFPSTVDSLRKRLKIKEGGNLYMFATTLLNDKKVLLLCK